MNSSCELMARGKGCYNNQSTLISTKIHSIESASYEQVSFWKSLELFNLVTQRCKNKSWVSNKTVRFNQSETTPLNLIASAFRA